MTTRVSASTKFSVSEAAIPPNPRYDEDATWTNRKGAAVVGAYVVDGGSYQFYAGDCVASGGVYNDRADCAHATAQVGVAATIGAESTVYGTYL